MRSFQAIDSCTTVLAYLDIDDEELNVKQYGGLGGRDELPDLLSDLWRRESRWHFVARRETTGILLGHHADATSFTRMARCHLTDLVPTRQHALQQELYFGNQENST